MNSSTTRLLIIIGLVLILGLLVWWLVAGRDGASDGATPDTGSGSPTECPRATPEFFTVEPVTSPTDQLTQVITVDLGNGETITVTSESGVFTAPFDTFPKEITIDLLPDTTQEQGVEAMQRLQRELTTRFFLRNNEKVLITFSAGVAQMTPQETATEAIRRADQGMYLAKRAGKNRVIAA